VGPRRRRLGAVILSLQAALRRERPEAAARDGAASYLERVLDGLEVAVLATDAEGLRVTANTAARVLFELPDGALSPADLRDAATRLTTGGRIPVDLQAAAVSRLLSTHEEGEHELLLLPPGTPASTPAAPNGPGPGDPPGPQHLVIRSRALHQRDGRRLGTLIVAHDVTDLHTRHELLARQAAQLAAIDQATRAILREADARAAVCQAAATASHAATAALMEPSSDGDLVCTAAHGVDLLGLRQPLDRPSMTVETFLSGRTRHLIRADRHPGVDQALLAHLSQVVGRTVTAGIWVPVLSRGRCLGVLATGYTAEAADIADQIPVLEILAAEAAVALERQDLLLRLEAEASSDALTGAANRRTWELRLPQAIDQAARGGSPLAVIILDLDHFKAYNDAHGHPAGDSLLCHLVAAWSARLRPSDLLARYGGEEFAVLLPGCDVTDAARVADELRALVPADQTCSAGVTTWIHGESPGTLIARADTALYAAKTGGRNQTIAA